MILPSGSKAVAAFLLITFISRTTSSQKSFSKNDLRHCGKHNFFNKTTTNCQSCQLCAPGTFVNSKCRGSKDTECLSCPSGYFSSIYSRYPGRCRRCRDCGMRKVLNECTGTSDTVCGKCPLGTYWDYVQNSCTECSYCYPEYMDALAVEPSCQKPQIPKSHSCSKTSWSPYKPPRLVSRRNEMGKLYFVSSKDIEEAESTTRPEYTTEYRSWELHFREVSTTRRSSRNRMVSSQTMSMKEVITHFEELYNTHCTRTLIFASMFCVFVLVLALICVLMTKRTRQVSSPDRKNLLETDA